MQVSPTRALPYVLVALAVGIAVPPFAAALVARSRGTPQAATVTLTPSLPPGEKVGTPITWTADVTGLATPIYQFSVARNGDPLRIVRDYRPAPSFTWVPMAEGTYTISVNVRDGFGSVGTITTLAGYGVLPRATGAAPVVSPTANALVALYSAPPCDAGQFAVAFRPTGAARWDATNWLPCEPGVTRNVYVAGMRANATYDLVHIVDGGEIRQFGPLVSFTTGTPPTLPRAGVILAPDDNASVADDVIVHSLASGVPSSHVWAYATDLAGRPLWYYLSTPPAAPLRLLAGGTVLFQSSEDDVRGQLLREVDLAGNTLRETSVTRLNEQLAALGGQPILAIHHDAMRTPSGLTLVMGFTERLFTDVQGATGEVDVLGDSIIALDRDWQVVWFWDAFDFLDVNRAATLGDTCNVGNVLCPPLELATEANDWLHMNSLDLLPDGNLVVSLRNQDWIIKIDFANGSGTGNVLWRLGQGGDFSLASADPVPWFSHQHSVSVAGPGRLAVFDNGNVRCQGAGPECHSRGQVYTLDEAALSATLSLNADVGFYSSAWGGAFVLSNGNFGFLSGKQKATDGRIFADTVEVDAGGSVRYDLRTLAAMYRQFRVKNLYLR